MKAGLVVASLAGFAIGLALGWSPALTVPTEATQAHSPPVRSEPQVAASPPAPTPVKRESPEAEIEPGAPPVEESPAFSPRKRLIRRLLRDWPDEARHGFLWSLLVGYKDAQARLLEFLLASSDPAVWEAGQDLLIANHDPEFVRRLVEAFTTETRAGRRSMLAHALGGNARSAEARVMIEQILSGSDATTLRAVLPRLNMEGFGDRTDAGLRIEARLRDLVSSGPTAEIRQKAVMSLRGGSSEDQTRFLLSVLEGNPDPQIRRAAIRSLPVTFSSHPPLLDQQLDSLWAIARSESCEITVRRSAADVLRNSTGKGRVAATEADQALIKKILDSKP